MKPEVPEWVAKAEGDFLTAQREYRARELRRMARQSLGLPE